MVFGLGQASIEVSFISNITQSVYCNSYRACYTAAMSFIDGNKYVNGCQDLCFTTILVFRNGYQSLAYLSVRSVSDSIHCVGELSCLQATLTGMKSVVASGNNALEYAAIYGAQRGELLVVNINNVIKFLFMVILQIVVFYIILFMSYNNNMQISSDRYDCWC